MTNVSFVFSVRPVHLFPRSSGVRSTVDGRSHYIRFIGTHYSSSITAVTWVQRSRKRYLYTQFISWKILLVSPGL